MTEKKNFKLSYEENGELKVVNLDAEAFRPCLNCMFNLFDMQMSIENQMATNRLKEYLTRLKNAGQQTDIDIFIRRNSRKMSEMGISA